MPAPRTLLADTDLPRLLEAIADGVIAADADGTVLYANPAAESLLGWPHGDLVGRTLLELTPERFRERHAGGAKQSLPAYAARLAGRPVRISLLDSAGSEIEIELLLSVLRSKAGDVFVGSMRDLRHRKRSDEANAVLTRMGKVLVSSLDQGAMLASLSELVVPAVADGFVVDVVDASGDLRRVAAVDAVPANVELVEALKNLAAPARDAAVYRVLELGEPTLLPTFDAKTIAAVARNEAHRAVLTALGVRSAIIAPLRARGRAIGILWLYIHDPKRRVYGDEDLPFVRDLAGRVALAVDNVRLFDDAQSAIRVRDEFLTVASHELKTPLTPLKLQLGRLRHEPLAESAAQKVVVCERQVDRLTRLVSQLLDVSRISVARLNLEPEEIDLGRLVEDVASDLAYDFQRSGSATRLDLAKGVTGLWDPLRLSQVVSNLVSNAIKYGQGKPIEITVTGDAHAARLTVEDHGIGIGAADQARIFDRFERAVSVRHYGGFGLGLWIAHQVVAASGGTIVVTSEVNRGSRFVMDLPRAPTSSSSLPPSQ